MRVEKSVDKIYMDFGIQGSFLIMLTYFLMIGYINPLESFCARFFKEEKVMSKIKFESA
jgi:hypothetical protein